jgi:hypothetical protein
VGAVHRVEEAPETSVAVNGLESVAAPFVQLVLEMVEVPVDPAAVTEMTIWLLVPLVTYEGAMVKALMLGGATTEIGTEVDAACPALLTTDRARFAVPTLPTLKVTLLVLLDVIDPLSIDQT